MRRLPQSFVDKVKGATDMVALAREYTELTPVGAGIYGGCCPHPDHNDSTPSFRVWEKEQSWCCMGCHYGKKDERFLNYGTDCIAFLRWISNGKVSVRQAILQLAARAGIPSPDDPNQKEYDKVMARAIRYHNALNSNVISYLESRGLNRNDIEEWGIGFDGSRITFPLPDADCNLIAFSRRRFMEEQNPSVDIDEIPKYKNSETSVIFKKGSYFFGLHKLDSSFPELRITEGQLDVILALKHGAKNIVGTLGTAFTEDHVDLIKHTKFLPVIVMDGDEAGIKAMSRTAEMLLDAGIMPKVVVLSEGRDLADMANNMGEYLEDWLRNKAVYYWQYALSQHVEGYIAGVNRLREELLSPAHTILDRCSDPVQRDLAYNYLKDQTGLEVYK